jgi:hypothetical protein
MRHEQSTRKCTANSKEVKSSLLRAQLSAPVLDVVNEYWYRYVELMIVYVVLTNSEHTLHIVIIILRAFRDVKPFALQ